MTEKRDRLEGLFDGELQTTAMIDVIFILLIFFVSVSRLKESRLELELPEVSTAQSEDQEPKALVIEVGEGGSLAFEGRPLESVAALEAELGALAKDPETVVHLRGDREAKHGDIAAVLGLLQKAGLRNVRFAVQ
ncbi:MAG: biopolymer transporter ExbD [Planctomycetota bacterium]